jgi:hypothetical protein
LTNEYELYTLLDMSKAGVGVFNIVINMSGSSECLPCFPWMVEYQLLRREMHSYVSLCSCHLPQGKRPGGAAIKEVPL